MAYRASAVEPKTPWARHLDAVMRERDWSRVRLFEEVSVDMGYRVKSRSAFLKFLDDKEPTPDQARVLARHFGEPPPEPETPTTESPPDLAAAIVALTAELREARQERQAFEVRMRAVEAELESLRGPQGGGESQGLSAPLETTGSA